jgi:hypothetical protein
VILDSNDVEPKVCSKFCKGGFEFHDKPRFTWFYYNKVIEDRKDL